MGSHLLGAWPVPGSVLSHSLQAHGDFISGKTPRWRNSDYPYFTGEEAAAHRTQMDVQDHKARKW